MKRHLSPEQKEARKIKRREWYRANVEAIRAYHREYSRTHRDKVTATLKAWQEKNRDKVRATQQRSDKKRGFKKRLMQRHMLTVEDYLRLLEDQGGCCAICLTEGPRHGDGIIRLDVDHDHKTDLIRGLLCNPCNTGIGHLNDDIETLKRGIAYLRRAERAMEAATPNKKGTRRAAEHRGKIWLDLGRYGKSKPKGAARLRVAAEKLVNCECKRRGR